MRLRPRCALETHVVGNRARTIRSQEVVDDPRGLERDRSYGSHVRVRLVEGIDSERKGCARGTGANAVLVTLESTLVREEARGAQAGRAEAGGKESDGAEAGGTQG